MRTTLVGYLVLAAALVAASTACDKGTGSATSPATTAAPSSSASSTPPAAPPDGAVSGCSGGVVSKDVTFASSGGLVVHATSSNPCGGAPRPVVVLAHQMCTDRTEWSKPTHDWVSAFSKRGIGTLAIDLRGHGQSKAFPDGSTHDLCAETSAPLALFAGMPDDVRAAVAYARNELKSPAIALVGASIGSNSALIAYAADAQTTMAVALSPGLDYHGIAPETAVTSLGARPVLLEAAQDDATSAAAVTQLKKDDPNAQTQVWPTGGHANAMIDAHPEELGHVADMVVAKLGPSATGGW